MFRVVWAWGELEGGEEGRERMREGEGEVAERGFALGENPTEGLKSSRGGQTDIDWLLKHYN